MRERELEAVAFGWREAAPTVEDLRSPIALLDEIGIPLTPVRLKCAMLGLTTLKVALHKAKGTPLPEGLAGFDELELS